MEFAVDKDTSVQVLLRRIAEIFVFFEDLLKAVTDLVEVFVGSSVGSVDFVLHLCLRCGNGDAAHDVKEGGSEH